MENSLSIIGAGRVGRALGRRLRELGWKIGVVVTRSEASARRAVRFIGAGKPHGGLTRQVLVSRVILIATPDDTIGSVVRELARMGWEELRGTIVLHTSGARDSRTLAPVKECGAAVGSMHPLQTFSGVGVPPLEGRVFAIEGDAGAMRMARQIVRALGGTPVHLESPKKPLYHAAGALAAGHMLALMEAATQMMMETGMNRREAVRALLPLTRQVLENFERLGPRAAWTGPLSRRDFGVVASHAAALRELPDEFLEAYQVLNRLSARVLSKDSHELLTELEKLAVKEKAAAHSSGGQS